MAFCIDGENLPVRTSMRNLNESSLDRIWSTRLSPVSSVSNHQSCPASCSTMKKYWTKFSICRFVKAFPAFTALNRKSVARVNLLPLAFLLEIHSSSEASSDTVERNAASSPSMAASLRAFHTFLVSSFVEKAVTAALLSLMSVAYGPICSALPALRATMVMLVWTPLSM